MSRVSFYTRPYDRLEPYDGKLSRTVLRGGAGSNASLLPDIICNKCPLFPMICVNYILRAFFYIKIFFIPFYNKIVWTELLPALHASPDRIWNWLSPKPAIMYFFRNHLSHPRISNRLIEFFPRHLRSS